MNCEKITGLINDLCNNQYILNKDNESFIKSLKPDNNCNKSVIWYNKKCNTIKIQQNKIN
jgi:hypothetical protein